MAVPAWLLLAAGMLAAVVACRAATWYLRFRRLELAIPGPPSLPFLGNALSFLYMKDDLAERLFALWGRQSRLSRISLCGHLLLFVSDPSDIELLIRGKATQDKARTIYEFMEYFTHDGLVTLNGAKWRAHRKAIQPAFYQDVLDNYQDAFQEECATYLARTHSGVEVQDVAEGVCRFVTSTFLRTALTLDKSGEEEARQFDRLLPIVIRALKTIPHAIMTRVFKPWLWPEWVYSFTATARELRHLRELVDAECDIGILRHRQQEAAGDDFFRKGRTLVEILNKAENICVLTDKEIRDELKILTGAGVETTTAGLVWTIKVLSVQPDVQRRVLLEIKDVLGEDKTFFSHHIPR